MKTLQTGYGFNLEKAGNLIAALENARESLLHEEEEYYRRASKVHPAFQISARNLLHYLTLRRSNLYKMQEELAVLGLSSLGRSESHVLSSLNAVLKILYCITGRNWTLPEPFRRAVTHHEGRAMIARHAEALFGAQPVNRKVRIMVTMPSEAADDSELIRNLLHNGMDCARINCAHDDPAVWKRIATHIRKASHELRKSCSILMDLAGPKLRTGALTEGPKVVKWRPKRDIQGHVIEEARIWLTAQKQFESASFDAVVLPVTASWLRALKPGSHWSCVDLRGKTRTIRIGERSCDGIWAYSSETAYIGPETAFWKGDGSLNTARRPSRKVVGNLSAVTLPIVLKPGDELLLTADPRPGQPAVYDSHGNIEQPAMISCSLAEIFSDIKPGESIFLDDGKIQGVIKEVSSKDAKIRIVRAKSSGSKLAAEKGINLPESNLKIKGLTPQDITDLEFITQHADLVALSFVRSPDDIKELHQHLRRLNAGQLGIIIKVETRAAVNQLPAILLKAMRRYPIGVMIARGDLAVELGYEQLAEAQEDILWICEASHVPVIWATQVLENLSKQGQPSRAEITDAAMSVRAECVMLNKGPFILNTLCTLDHILHSMEGRHMKKDFIMKALNTAVIPK